MTDAPSLEATMIETCRVRGPGKTCCPTEVARAHATALGRPETWHDWIAPVRVTAVGLARERRIVITRKGKAVDPDAFRGVYRLSLPPAD